MARRGRRNGKGMFSGHKLYLDIGIFALVFIAYLWVAPKLLKKPAGTPPRNGSNEQQQQINRTASGMTPEPVGAPGTSPSPPTSGAAATPTGTQGGFVMSPTTAIGSSNLLGGPVPYNVGGQSSSAGIGKVGGYAARVFPMTKISYQ